jgi:Raf kinase inhibitor-like YbhB/YbcL family protein
MASPTVSVRAPDGPKHAKAVSVLSTTFKADGPIPVKCAYAGCGGENVSPQLSWSNVPEGTKSFALICFDPDAPTGSGFYHWIVANIPASVTSIAENTVPSGAVQGSNDYGESQYGGPCPPTGDSAHRYHFTVYALDTPSIPGAGPTMTGARLVFSMRGHLLAKGTLTGMYAR